MEDGAGKLFLIVTISGRECIKNKILTNSFHIDIFSGTTSHDCETFLTNWDHSQFAVDQRAKNYSIRNSFRKFETVGSLVVKVYRAKGLYAADLGRSSDPFCVLELGNFHKMHLMKKTI